MERRIAVLFLRIAVCMRDGEENTRAAGDCRRVHFDNHDGQPSKDVKLVRIDIFGVDHARNEVDAGAVTLSNRADDEKPYEIRYPWLLPTASVTCLGRSCMFDQSRFECPYSTAMLGLLAGLL